MEEPKPIIEPELLKEPQQIPTGHPMITRSKSGIYKPKIYLAKREQKDIECMPGNTKSAMQDNN